MALVFNPNLYPPGGWFFVDSNGVKHVASGYTALVNAVTQYRQRNHFPLGDPASEVTVQLCSRAQGFCKDSNQTAPPARQKQPAHLAQKILDRLGALVREKRFNRIKLVPKSEAQRRAEICARCPKQVGIPLTCGACIADVEKMRRGILGEDPVHQGIQACVIWQDDLQTAVHLETGGSDHSELPDFCWRKKK